MRDAFLAIAALPVLLAGCAAQGPFPSLAPRAVERELGDGPALTGRCGTADGDGCYAPAGSAPAEAAAVPDDPQLRARLSELVAAARRGQTDFAALVPRASQSAARAGAAGSESWIAAQQEVSRLEAARSPTVDALVALDGLVIARSRDRTSAADYGAVLAAAEEVRGLAETQQAELQRISAALNPG